MTVIFDSHAHLTDTKFAADLDSVIERAYSVGVTHILAVADTIQSCSEVLVLSKKREHIYSTAGIHPHYAATITENERNTLKTFLQRHPEIKAIGETGLDFYYGKDTVEEQIELFRYHLNLAVKFDLPVIIHCRDAENVILSVIQDYASLRGVFHCFSGDKNFCTQVLEMGYYVSFSGIITFSKAESIRQAAHIAPLEKVLVETDCPYLAPEGFRGKRNEPSFIPSTIERLAQIKGYSFEEIACITTQNAKNLLNIQD